VDTIGRWINLDAANIKTAIINWMQTIYLRSIVLFLSSVGLPRPVFVKYLSLHSKSKAKRGHKILQGVKKMYAVMMHIAALKCHIH
jgi:hypothetical protein